MTRASTLGLLLAGMTGMALTHALAAGEKPANAPGGDRVFELRTYYTHPGRLDALNKRFREHTCALFEKHGMQLIGFWTPQPDQKGQGETLVYLLAFPGRDAAKKAWDGFRDDPEWKKAKEESEKDGPIVKEVVSQFLDPTDYSAIK